MKIQCKFKHPSESIGEWYVRTGTTQPNLPPSSEASKRPSSEKPKIEPNDSDSIKTITSTSNQTNLFTRPCEHVVKPFNENGAFGVCTRKLCTFAHSLEELKIPHCGNGEKCKHINGKKDSSKKFIIGTQCKFKHPQEDEEQWKVRTNYVVPDLPKTSKDSRKPQENENDSEAESKQSEIKPKLKKLLKPEKQKPLPKKEKFLFVIPQGEFDLFEVIMKESIKVGISYDIKYPNQLSEEEKTSIEVKQLPDCETAKITAKYLIRDELARKQNIRIDYPTKNNRKSII